MDVNLINPFLTATINLFDQMFQLEATPGTPYVLTNLLGHRWEISGLLGITGEAKGIIAIRFHNVLLDKLLKKSGIVVSGEEEREETCNAMVGELVNIISGNAVSSFTNRNIDISVPVIVQGEDHRLAWPKIAPVVGIPFRTNAGDFEVQVCFKPD